MSGPYAGEQPQQPGYPPRPQQPWQPPSQPFARPPIQPFSQPPAQQLPRPVGWRPVEPPPPFQPQADRSFSSVRGLGTAVSILIGLVALGEALFAAARHRHGRGWLIGGWFCPTVNFWFPKQIVDDVIAASDPRTRPRVPDLRGIRGNGLVLAWWLTWVAGLVFFLPGDADTASDVPDVGDQVIGASLSTISAVLYAVCAVLAIRVIGLI